MRLTCILPAPWPRAPGLRSKRPTAAAPFPRPLCRGLHSLLESLLRHSLCILPEHRLHAETTDGLEVLQEPAERVRPRGEPRSTESHPAADSSASPGSSRPRPESALPL